MAFQSLQLMWDVNADPRFKPYNVKSKVNILEQKEILTTNMEMHHIEVRRNTMQYVLCFCAPFNAKFPLERLHLWPKSPLGNLFYKEKCD